MATITYTNNAPDYLWDTIPDDFSSFTIRVNSARTSATVTYAGVGGGDVTKLVFTGTGLRADESGFLAGTLTGLTSYGTGNAAVYRMTGLSVRASSIDLFDSAQTKGALLAGNDLITGSSGHDDIQSGAGNDTVRGGAGDDSFQDHQGNDRYEGGSGEDFVYFSQGYYDSWFPSEGVTVNLRTGRAIDPWGGRDTLVSIEGVRGTHHDDRLTGSDKATFEYFQGVAGNDTIDGGGGDEDRVDYGRDARFGGRAGVTVDLSRGRATDGFGDTDTLINIEQVAGSNYADRITGDTGANSLRGRGGNDILIGKGGGDGLEGEGGNDTLYGTAGSEDVFRFRDRGDGVTSLGTDRIKTFTDREDIIRFQDIDGLDSRGDLDLEQVGANVVITYDMGRIIVENITVARLTAADFDFA